VLFGVSYGIKSGAHIGIDVLVRQFPHGAAPRHRSARSAVLLRLLHHHADWLGRLRHQNFRPRHRSPGFADSTLGTLHHAAHWTFLGLTTAVASRLATLTGEHEGLQLADEARDAIESVEGLEVVEAVEILHPAIRLRSQGESAMTSLFLFTDAVCSPADGRAHRVLARSVQHPDDPVLH
jgi:hypothetical protein